MDKSSKSEDLMSQMQKGMVVYDVSKERVGSISDIYLSDAGDDVQTSASNPATSNRDDMSTLPGVNLINTVLPISTPSKGLSDFNAPASASFSVTIADGIPEPLRARLLQQGFIRVKGIGIIADVYYATPDQLASVNVKDVYLSITRAQLISNR